MNVRVLLVVICIALPRSLVIISRIKWSDRVVVVILSRNLHPGDKWKFVPSCCGLRPAWLGPACEPPCPAGSRPPCRRLSTAGPAAPRRPWRPARPARLQPSGGCPPSLASEGPGSCSTGCGTRSEVRSRTCRGAPTPEESGPQMSC